jgi:quercetin dioxygenase-like cupin family protein
VRSRMSLSPSTTPHLQLNFPGMGVSSLFMSSTMSRWMMQRRCSPFRPRSAGPLGPGRVTQRTRGMSPGCSTQAHRHNAFVYTFVLQASSM